MPELNQQAVALRSERRLCRRNPSSGLGGGKEEHAVRRATTVGEGGAEPPSE